MDMKDPTLWDRALVAASGIVTWLTGEAGRALIAGAAGGLYRWLMQERRRLRDGVVAVLSGAVAAQYLGPVVLALLRMAGLKLTEGPELYLTSGFLAGLAGMSLAKLMVALMEAQAARLRGERGK
ncbi:hypothetical protein SAMN04490248_1691 [Salinihabitans flavidus]|uniref:Uncharacterized protein n=1 Tax=Salinihabitans flavidus TaxID=569882 RepID=A0A1H8WJ04_9RHOB|nr:hypothetical protein [Salinihabitans flavidus]SEP27621.1 hypothetical protein SAMN04490248_1691 [Salinihabitans flavidus]